MKLNLVIDFLKTLPNYKESSDGTHAYLRCPFCYGGKHPDETHFGIKIDVEEGECMLYHCFRASCGESGILNTEKLQRFGCTDMDTILELAKYNSKISKSIDRFTPKKNKNLITLNINNEQNNRKLSYINNRLGINLSVPNLKELKIQLSLYDYLNINHIRKLAFPKDVCDVLNLATIGFISMYEDYVICRDISKNLITGNRYTIYRSTGIADPGDMKIYCIPCEIDLTDSEPATLNIAEGPFSILGAYINTDIGKDTRNSVFLANCGSGYLQTIRHVCKQFGFLDVCINIFSDSEIKINYYKKLVNKLKSQINIESFIVYYNDKGEDFGVSINNIKLRRISII